MVGRIKDIIYDFKTRTPQWNVHCLLWSLQCVIKSRRDGHKGFSLHLRHYVYVYMGLMHGLVMTRYIEISIISIIPSLRRPMSGASNGRCANIMQLTRYLVIPPKNSCLEMVQRRAARFPKNDYRHTTSVTELLMILNGHLCMIDVKMRASISFPKLGKS